MKVLIDTGTLIDPPPTFPSGTEGIVSILSRAELEFGITRARNERQRAERLSLLRRFDAQYTWLPLNEEATRARGFIAALTHAVGRPGHARSVDMLIAAHAYSVNASILTRNTRDFDHLTDVMTVLHPDTFTEADIVMNPHKVRFGETTPLSSEVRCGRIGTAGYPCRLATDHPGEHD